MLRRCLKQSFQKYCNDYRAFVLTTITFILMKLSPGNPVNKILHLDTSQVSQSQIKATEHQLDWIILYSVNGGIGSVNYYI